MWFFAFGPSLVSAPAGDKREADHQSKTQHKPKTTSSITPELLTHLFATRSSSMHGPHERSFDTRALH